MKFKTDFVSFQLDLAAYQKALLNALHALNERAGQAWIHAAVDKTPIPTWSGASRATFQKLARELGTSVPIGPLRTKSRVSLGLSTSSGSGVEENKQAWYVGFVYTTNLRYLAYNEYNSAKAGSPPAPWSNNVRFTPYNFQDRAKSAWQTVAAKAELPNPYHYLQKRKM
jgi:hypothetical protein